MALVVKNLPTNARDVGSLGQEDPLEKEMATHYSILAWEIPWTEMSLLLNMLSRLVITFLPRSKSLLISWLQSLSAVILEPRKTKSQPLFPLFPHLFAMK